MQRMQDLAHLKRTPPNEYRATIDGEKFVVQFFADGDRMGELATAFHPKPAQLSAMYRRLG